MKETSEILKLKNEHQKNTRESLFLRFRFYFFFISLLIRIRLSMRKKFETQASSNSDESSAFKCVWVFKIFRWIMLQHHKQAMTFIQWSIEMWDQS